MSGTFDVCAATLNARRGGARWLIACCEEDAGHVGLHGGHNARGRFLFWPVTT